MRVLRASIYTDPNKPPTMVIVRDCDVRDTLESVRVSSAESVPDGLALYDLFEMSDGDEEAATFEAGRRITEDVRLREKNQALLYFYTVQRWRIVKAGGTMLADRPAPLTAEEIRAVFEQLAQHPDYENYSYMIPAKDGTLVSLSHGQVK